jgi:hypothetical protein
MLDEWLVKSLRVRVASLQRAKSRGSWFCWVAARRFFLLQRHLVGLPKLMVVGLPKLEYTRIHAM